MAEERPFAARRILVAIDASAASLAAVAAATTLAARLGSELAGIFVEDEGLLRLADLPFGDLVRSPDGARERLDRASAEGALRALAQLSRAALERTASERRVACSFRVVRGRIVGEVLSAAASADLVVLGAAGHARPARGAVGETARAAALRAPAPVLLVSRAARLGGVVVAVDDGSPAGARALAAATRLEAESRRPAVVPGGGGDLALVDRIVRLAPALVVLPPVASAAPGGVVDRLLGAGLAVLLVR